MLSELLGTLSHLKVMKFNGFASIFGLHMGSTAEHRTFAAVAQLAVPQHPEQSKTSSIPPI